MTKWFSMVASVCGLMLASIALLVNGCEGGSSADVVTRNVGLIVEGFYRHSDPNSSLVPRTSGQPIDSINLRQFGDQLEGIDNHGIVYSGTIGQVASSNRASFNMQGRSTIGAEAVIAGSIAVQGDTATMTGTYIEPTLVSTVFGVATVPTNAVPPPSTNLTVSVTPSFVSIDAAGGTTTFTASGGEGDFSWVVSNPGIGNFSQISGDRNASATYVAAGAGNNTITVRDAGGEAASAGVQQSTDPSTEPTVDPVTLNQTLVTISIGSSASFTASGGTGSFSWSVVNPFLGAISSISGSRNENATYTAGATVGENLLTVVDRQGGRASATVRIQEFVLPSFP